MSFSEGFGPGFATGIEEGVIGLLVLALGSGAYIASRRTQVVAAEPAHAWVEMLGITLAVSALAAYALGTETDCQNYDGFRSGCETLGSDLALTSDRWRVFARTLVFLLVAGSVGGVDGQRKRREQASAAGLPTATNSALLLSGVRYAVPRVALGVVGLATLLLFGVLMVWMEPLGWWSVLLLPLALIAAVVAAVLLGVGVFKLVARVRGRPGKLGAERERMD